MTIYDRKYNMFIYKCRTLPEASFKVLRFQKMAGLPVAHAVRNEGLKAEPDDISKVAVKL